MAITNFKPKVWAARLQKALEKSLVFAQPGTVDMSYEGEISEWGDSVQINMIGDPTIGDYTPNTDISSPEALNDAGTTLLIDQGKYFNFQVDDIDRRQSKPQFIDEAARRGAYQFKDRADQHVASEMYTGTDTGNMVGTSGSPKTITSANESYSYLVDLKTALDEANVPTDGRFCIVPPWFHSLLLKRQEFVFTAAAASQERLVNGFVGEAAGFRILNSNNVVKSGSDYRIQAGVDMATAFAQQILKVEAYRPEKRFADAIKGLHLYGCKVIRPEMLAVLHCTRPS